jgi:hypothetical protein
MSNLTESSKQHEEAKSHSSLNPDVSNGCALPLIKDDKKTKVVSKTKVVCAINERELNKVELAYFKRPLPIQGSSVILSDR